MREKLVRCLRVEGLWYHLVMCRTVPACPLQDKLLIVIAFPLYEAAKTCESAQNLSLSAAHALPRMERGTFILLG